MDTAFELTWSTELLNATSANSAPAAVPERHPYCAPLKVWTSPIAIVVTPTTPVQFDEPAGSTVTVVVSALPFDDEITSAVPPWRSAFTRPLASTLTSVGSEALKKIALVGAGLPNWSCAVTLTRAVSPT